MPKSRMNEINFVGTDREARLALATFVVGLVQIGKPVDAEYISHDPGRAHPPLGPLKIGNSEPGSIGSDTLFDGHPVAPQGATR